ncbi:tetratricopeptide repeat protein [Massilia rubra]|uniref:Tetratricopeptide repeat protein n=1 Tax=Massilia rubra TaxID=2607910 RepID=A0ABX0LP07_9BURK|nr:hypothetical protein [Massilia rubra]NHZ34413.1 hypothetical protein [Massilia rubra]
MSAMYPKLTNWSDLPRLNADEFFAIFPLAEEAYEDDESEFYDGDVDDLEFIVIKGDVSISREQLQEMDATLQNDRMLRIAVDGHAQVDGSAYALFVVKGDLHCNWLGIDTSWASYSVHGRVYARDCVFVSASDEGWMRTLPATRIDTPLLFLWNYKPDTIDLNPDAVMFVLGFEWWGSKLPNRCYAHKEIVHRVDRRFLTPFTCEYSEEDVLDSGAIIRALAAGESIYRSGFDVRCDEALDAAIAAINKGDYRLGYFYYKQAATIWPDFYPAYMGMAGTLCAVSAHAQAYDVYLEASKRFPPEQTGLVNDALNMAARIALRFGWLELAYDLSTQSIDFTRVSGWEDKLLTEGYWIRAETCIAQGDMAAAQRDLEQSLRFDQGEPQPNWLMGQLCFRRGDLEQARAFHAKAARRWSGTPYYDVADTYIEGFNPVSVDWDQRDPATVLPA